jgi:prevent-host-death family protein
MVIYDDLMAISVTDFKAKCLHLIRQVEAHGTPIDIVRRGRVVARLTSAVPLDSEPRGKPGSACAAPVALKPRLANRC